MDLSDERQSVLIYCLYAQHVEEPSTIAAIHQEWARLSSAAKAFWSLVDLGLQAEEEVVDPEFDISQFTQKKKKRNKRGARKRRNGR